MLEVTKKKTVKTQKKYECRGCCEAIDKGDAAVHVRGKEDGRYIAFHLHVKCHILIMKQKLFVEGFQKGSVKPTTTRDDYSSVDETSYPF